MPMRHAAPESPTWWWTIATAGHCEVCWEPVRNRVIAYEPFSRATMCYECAEYGGIAEGCRESKRAKQARQQAMEFV